MKSQLAQAAMPVLLTPAQRAAAEGLRDAISFAGILVLRGRAGSGKSTILQWLHAIAGGVHLDCAGFMRSIGRGAPNAMDNLRKGIALSDIDEVISHDPYRSYMETPYIDYGRYLCHYHRTSSRGTVVSRGLALRWSNCSSSSASSPC